MTRVGMIWAQTPAGVIGADNAIPWRVPEDMAHFKAVTAGHPVLMGRRTWDSLSPRFRPLPGRRNIVITRQPDWAAPGAERAGSIRQALELTGTDPVWIMGGGEIYRAAMDYATELMVTEVDADIPGDAYAPEIAADWQAEDTPWSQSRSGLRYRIRHFTRASAPAAAR
ncbi:dihydrofolate reductase [Nocardia vermiculata]|uniref:Dihydrofolate reductase n=1 Tax=Nocardia vermiculata TaxID=257274 RepID=A0A846XNX2_9NOCA|nr:dihydrofolate reductase [Nocardia vermiculata]NKY48686.1 dihydrofolate reductase [Nocardia vermiculata]